MSKIYRAYYEQHLKSDIDTVWKFISNPLNLKTITPEYMNFEVISGLDIGTMYEGQIICYRVSPMHGIRTTWVTEISHMESGKYFVDEQRFGPYSFWHHKHFINAHPEGVMMYDIIDYKIPYGWVGDVANMLFVRRKIDEIFEYRKVVLNNIFS
ncbi:MAG: SRPBCC family protein [Cytophagales bacterium]|nr:SRPBCC family protein [Cytophagales bacterium]